MADKKRPNRPAPLDEDELVTSLIPDPSVLPDARVMVGFLGRSARERHWRLYLTSSLNEYVEFAEADVLHTRPLEVSGSPLGGTAVWLRREANVVRTRAASREAQTDFIQGEILAKHLAAVPRRSRLAQFRGGFIQAKPFYTAYISCVPEFCEFVPASPEWWCTPLCSWEAECP